MTETQADRKIATHNPSSPAGSHPAFEALRQHQIAALHLTVEEFRHKATGALHYHLASDNPENVFLVAFRTVPMDSTGVAHILEHTALCGSEHYPVRDPFFMMIRRSLNTFMNAFTSSDWTAYPFASQNRKDFNNLLDVYLDAAFFSRLHELDFAQEGHRLEFAEPDNPESPLLFKGVVFNEMKGSMSSTVNTLWQTLTEHVFPTTTYHYNSGGEPADIPDLSYEQLKSFYKSHYHPSNAVFMTYGNIPARELQQRFEERALSRFDRLDEVIAVSDEIRFSQPQTVTARYAAEESDTPEAKTHVVLGWLLGKNTDARELLKAHLLSSALLDNGASPLRHALETTDRGTAPSPLCGLEDSNHEMTFMCGLEGSSPDNAEAVEKLVLDVLQDVADNGLPREQLDAVLHQLELSQREIKGDGYPYGLQLILEALPAAIHRGDPMALLDIEPVLAELREAITNPNFIKELARDWLLNNPHRVRLTMVPDAGLNTQREQQERARLDEIKSRLTEPEKQRIVEQALALAERQQTEDDPEVLPKVGLEDVPATVPTAEGESVSAGGQQISFYDQGTNGIVYEQVITQLPYLDDDLLPLLPDYTSVLTEVGVGKDDYLATQARQDAVSGGINASTTIRGAVNNEQQISGHFILSTKALARNAGKADALLHDTFGTPRFDELQRIRETITKDRARAEQSVTGNGHALAMMAASSGMSPVSALNHRLRGLQGIRTIKELDDSLTSAPALQALADKLAQLHEHITAAPRQFLLIAEAERRDELLNLVDRNWGQAVPAGHRAFALPSIRGNVRQLWLANTQVNFCARAYPTVPVEHEDAAALAVLGGFLRNGYLHRAIREQGGAYGGGAGQDSDNATFRFFSYRDPRLTETLSDFDQSIDWLLDHKHEWRQVEEAILGVVGSLDKPGSPAGEAKKAFYNALYGRTPEQRQRFRSRVLAVKLDDLRRVGETYLKPEMASTAVITHAGNKPLAEQLGLKIEHL